MSNSLSRVGLSVLHGRVLFACPCRPGVWCVVRCAEAAVVRGRSGLVHRGGGRRLARRCRGGVPRVPCGDWSVAEHGAGLRARPSGLLRLAEADGPRLPAGAPGSPGSVLQLAASPEKPARAPGVFVLPGVGQVLENTTLQRKRAALASFYRFHARRDEEVPALLGNLLGRQPTGSSNTSVILMIDDR